MCVWNHVHTDDDIVLPEGPDVIVGQELGGEYFEKAGPVIERQVARAGYRMAAWLDHIAREFQEKLGEQESWTDL